MQFRKSNVVTTGTALTTDQLVLFCCVLSGCDLNYVCLRLKIDQKPQEVSKSLPFSPLTLLLHSLHPRLRQL